MTSIQTFKVVYVVVPTHYHQITITKTKEIKFEPKIKLSHNIYTMNYLMEVTTLMFMNTKKCQETRISIALDCCNSNYNISSRSAAQKKKLGVEVCWQRLASSHSLH